MNIGFSVFLEEKKIRDTFLLVYVTKYTIFHSGNFIIIYSIFYRFVFFMTMARKMYKIKI